MRRIQRRHCRGCRRAAVIRTSSGRLSLKSRILTSRSVHWLQSITRTSSACQAMCSRRIVFTCSWWSGAAGDTSRRRSQVDRTPPRVSGNAVADILGEFVRLSFFVLIYLYSELHDQCKIFCLPFENDVAEQSPTRRLLCVIRRFLC